MTQLLATDLDGTIHSKTNGFNSGDIETLHLLGKNGVCRVIATGRTFQSALSVIPRNFPIDYLVFSSGAGIYDWKHQQLLRTINLGYTNTKNIIEILNSYNIEYTVHHPIPDNHIFFHSVSPNPHPDFERYIAFNSVHAIPEEKILPQEDYSQTLAFVKDINIFDEIQSQFKNVKTIRATSPIDGESIWMECFNQEVSKAKGIQWLCKQLTIEEQEVTTIGNDYNDLDMLRHFSSAFVVDNAPKELKQELSVLPDVFNAPVASWYKNHR